MSKETDVLYEMFEKYAPTQDIDGNACFTKESSKWFDNIVYCRRKIEALDIVRNGIVAKPDIPKMTINGKEYIMIEIMVTPKEWELIKEAMYEKKRVKIV